MFFVESTKKPRASYVVEDHWRSPIIHPSTIAWLVPFGWFAEAQQPKNRFFTGKYFISFDKNSDRWNKWVTAKELRLPGFAATGPASPLPASPRILPV
jgi:hypothetical protein